MARPRFLSLASEWASRRGGLSTLNRSLCRALAAAGYETICLVPRADQVEVDDARQSGVELIAAPHVPGLSDEAALCLPADVGDVDVVIGHGHISGAAAAARIACLHPKARRIHVLHTTPEELEWLKSNAEAAARAAAKQHDQARLAGSATFALAVGPRLSRQWRTHLAGEQPEARVHRLDPGIEQTSRVTSGPPPELECLLLGRAEDAQIKGIDIAARALGHLRVADGFFVGPNEPILVIRGARPRTEVALYEELKVHAGTGLRVNVKPYTDGVEEVRKDLLRASLVLMPSRAEGFGLVALEAIAHGVPVLVSSRSGIAELLYERANASSDDAFALDSIVDVKDDSSRDQEAWAAAVGRVLKDRKAAFDNAAKLRARLLEARYWERTITEITGQLELITNAPSVPRSSTENAMWWAERAPNVSVERATESLDVEVSKFAAERGVSTNPVTVLIDLVAKGFVSKEAASQLSELFHRRNVAVHSPTPDVGKMDAVVHAHRVELALERLKTHADEKPIRAIFDEAAADADALISHLRDEINEIRRDIPASSRGTAVIMIADTDDPSARRVAEVVLRRAGRPIDFPEPIFFAAQPVQTVLDVLKEADVWPLPPSLVDPVPPENRDAIRILVLMRIGYHVKWWTPPP